MHGSPREFVVEACVGCRGCTGHTETGVVSCGGWPRRRDGEAVTVC